MQVMPRSETCRGRTSTLIVGTNWEMTPTSNAVDPASTMDVHLKRKDKKSCNALILKGFSSFVKFFSCDYSYISLWQHLRQLYF